MSASAGPSGEWLRHARSDLSLAKTRGDGVTEYETRCFLAQQAAEKAIKAVLLHHAVVQQFAHNIGLLIDQLDQARIPRPPNLTEVTKLTDYAVHTRYPYAGPQVDEAM